MTSGETAQGQFPVNVIETMKNINKEAEFLFDYETAKKEFAKMAIKTKMSAKAKKTALAIAKATYPTLATTPKASFPYEFIVIFENNEEVINAISGIRPGAAIIVVLDDPKLYNAFGLSYGINTYLVSNIDIAKKQYKKIAADAVKKFSEGSKKAACYINNKFIKL
jgi:pyruvate kinase